MTIMVRPRNRSIDSMRRLRKNAGERSVAGASVSLVSTECTCFIQLYLSLMTAVRRDLSAGARSTRRISIRHRRQPDYMRWLPTRGGYAEMQAAAEPARAHQTAGAWN